jgi:hypothetical protein
LAARCSLTGARKGLFAKSPFRRNSPQSSWFRFLTGIREPILIARSETQ